LISNKNSLKKRKTPINIHEVYKGATQLAHMKNPRKPTRNYIPTTPKTHMKPKIQKKPPTNTQDTIETPHQTPKIQSNPHNTVKPKIQ